jgi:hypothetical protein
MSGIERNEDLKVISDGISNLIKFSNYCAKSCKVLRGEDDTFSNSESVCLSIIIFHYLLKNSYVNNSILVQNNIY